MMKKLNFDKVIYLIKPVFLAFVLILLSFGYSTTTYAQDSVQWSQSFTPRFRNINAIAVINDNRIILAGGNESNDAISTLITSNDSGSTWSLTLDAVDAILTDITFPNSTVGYAVGWNGKFLKTTDAGVNWNAISLPGNLANRNYNACYFWDENKGIVVGGNKSNDAIQTIIKTVDGGANWSVVSDNLNPWLNAVEFADANTGFAVGENGRILKSTNGGDNWTALTLPGSVANRNYKDVHVFDANRVIVVGGNLKNDSIQTVLLTTDGGANWQIKSDKVASILNAVDFHTEESGFAVGNDGVVLFSKDRGETWTNFNIEANLDYHLRTINFTGPFYGFLSGSSGNLLKYVDEGAVLAAGTLQSPVEIKQNGVAVLQGTVNDNGAVSSVFLEYGTSLSFGQEIAMNPNTTAGNGLDLDVNVELTGLEPNKYYYARIKLVNTVGTSYSKAVNFYLGNNEVANWGFENWQDYVTEELQNWTNSGNITKVTAKDQSFAAQLGGNPQMEFGAILFGIPGEQGLIGGLPYSDRPSSISFDAEYNIASGDAALVLLQFKKNGEVISNTMEQITGVSTGWETINFDISFDNADTPDSVIVAFTSSNVFSGNTDPNSFIKVDNVLLNGGQNLPNYDMENWATNTRYKADLWVSSDDERDYSPNMVQRSTDSYGGNYALLLSNVVGNQETQFARINSGDQLFDQKPSFRVSQNYQKFYGYVKPQIVGGDSLFVSLSMYSEGESIANGFLHIQADNGVYSPFSVDLQYFNQSIADSCRIEFFIVNRSGGPSNSSVLIDNLSFDGLASSISQLHANDKKTILFPNPTEGLVYLKVPKNAGEIKLVLFDIQGKIIHLDVDSSNAETLVIDLNKYAKQSYMLRVEMNDTVEFHKIIVR